MAVSLEQGAAQAAQDPFSKALRNGLTPRAVLAGVVCVGLVSLLVTWAELIVVNIQIGYLQLPPVAVVMLLVLLAPMRLTGRLLKRRFGFTPLELVCVYVMSLVAAMVASHGVVQRLLALLVAPNYFATATNGWQQIFFTNIKPFMVPWDPRGLPRQPVPTQFYEGIARDGSIPWEAWIVPLAFWGSVILLVLFAFLCLTTILRRQWIDNEKLAFPLAQLPLEIINGHDSQGRGFLRNPMTWWGIAIPVVFFGIDWAHQLAPAVPLIPVNIDLHAYMTTPPYSLVGGISLIVSFAAVGFFYLLPSDILFSIWFFFVLSKLEQLLGAMRNMDMPGMPIYPPPLFVGYQTVGAYVVLVGYLFMIGLPHLSHVWNVAMGKEKADDSAEILPFKVAFWGLFASLLVACGLLSLTGMSFWLAALDLFGLVFIIGLVMARSTAEAGMLMTETTFRPIDLFRLVGNVHSLGPVNLTALAFVDNLLLRDQRGLLLTGMLDSARLGDGVGLSRRSLAKTIVLGILVALVVSIGLQLYYPYTLAGVKLDNWMEQGSALITFNDYAPYFKPGMAPLGGGWQAPVFFAVGVAMTLFLSAMRSMFFWWPLHPLGYALSGSWSTVEFWFPCFVAWVFKSSDAALRRHGDVSTRAPLVPGNDYRRVQYGRVLRHRQHRL